MWYPSSFLPRMLMMPHLDWDRQCLTFSGASPGVVVTTGMSWKYPFTIDDGNSLSGNRSSSCSIRPVDFGGHHIITESYIRGIGSGVQNPKSLPFTHFLERRH